MRGGLPILSLESRVLGLVFICGRIPDSNLTDLLTPYISRGRSIIKCLFARLLMNYYIFFSGCKDGIELS